MKEELLVIGVSHRTAPVQVRERLAVAPTEIDGTLREVAASPVIREVVLVSTCNRVELYAVSPDPAAAMALLRQRFAAALDGQEARVTDAAVYQRQGREAVHHLFRVAASLDSMVPGEAQILGQLKQAFATAQKAGTASASLGFQFTRAFRVARRVRRETGIAQNPVSISSVAVDLAHKVWEGFTGLGVLLIGAGKMSDLAARALRAQGATVAVTNRTRARADEIAARLGCKVEPFEDLALAIGRADIVITSTGAREPILRHAAMAAIQKARRWRPLFVVDIAVPRDVEPSVGELDGVFLYNIDELQQEAARNLQGRRLEADRAEAMVEEEVQRALAVTRGRAVGPTIAALRARLQSLGQAEAERLLARLPTLDERGRKDVLLMAETLVNKILHAPQVALKQGAASVRDDALVDAVHRLFDLPDGNDEPAAAEATGEGAGETAARKAALP